MNIGELVEALESIPFGEISRIMVLPNNGSPLSITDVREEPHNDADGNTIVWIVAEEV